MIEPLTDPAHTEHDTEPMPAVRADSPERCGVCGKTAEPYIYCCDCHTPLCKIHIELIMTVRGVATACPEHKGGE